MRLLLLVAALFSLSACTKVAFKVSDKQAVLKSNVLGDGGGDNLNDGDDLDDGVYVPGMPGYPRPSPTPKKYPYPLPSATPKYIETASPTPTATPVSYNVPVNRH